MIVISSVLVFDTSASFATSSKNKTIKSNVVKSAKRSNVSTVINTLLNGIGAPSASIGINGDFYIDTITMNIYGPKKKNAWPIPKSLIGPPGVAGIPGKQGANGKDGRDGVNGKDGINGKDGERGAAGATGAPGASGEGAGVPGPVGPAGPAGPAGPTGATGSAGASGAAGATGAQGEVGPRGLQGIQGIQGETGPRGLQGLQGDVGATGAAGAAGAQGIQGIQGVTGATGPAGPVKVFLSDLTFVGLLSGNPGTTKNAADFGSLVTGKKYLLTAYVYAISDLTSLPPLSVSVSAVGASVTPVVKFSTTYGHTYRSSTDREESGVSVVATINGASLVGADYQLRLGVTCGTNTSGVGSGLDLAGYYLLQEVSEIN